MARILIIEDEPAIVMVLQEMLMDEGYDVSKAYEGKTGLKMLKEMSKPDLVIMDLNMPGIGGRGVIEAMRSDPELREIPVIVITGAVYNTFDFPPPGSFQAILEKPFELADLLKKVQELL